MSEGMEARRPVVPTNDNPDGAEAMLRQFLNYRDARFYVLLLQDGEFKLQAHGNAAACLRQIKPLLGKDVHLFVFCGYQLPISKPPHQYLVMPTGNNLPLFDLPTRLEVAEDGYVGGEFTISHLAEPAVEPRRRRIDLRDAVPAAREIDTGETAIFPEGDREVDDDES